MKQHKLTFIALLMALNTVCAVGPAIPTEEGFESLSQESLGEEFQIIHGPSLDEELARLKARLEVINQRLDANAERLNANADLTTRLETRLEIMGANFQRSEEVNKELKQRLQLIEERVAETVNYQRDKDEFISKMKEFATKLAEAEKRTEKYQQFFDICLRFLQRTNQNPFHHFHHALLRKERIRPNQ